MKKEIVGEDQGTSEKISDGDVTNRFGALFTRPIGVRVPLDKLEELDSAGDGDSGGAPGVLTHRGASGGMAPKTKEVGPHQWRVESVQQELGRRRTRAQPEKARRSEADAVFTRWGLDAE